MSRSLDLLTDVCSGLPLAVRKMFGGYGFFAPNGGMFAGIVTDDDVILKLEDEKARNELIALGGRPWTYDGKGAPMTMRTWIVVPVEFYDDLEQFALWAHKAHALVPAKRAKKATVRTPSAAKKARPATRRPSKAPAPTVRSKRRRT
jgi:DNA transformation protein